MAIYMKIDGIDGHVTAKGYEKWIELDSFQFGVNRSIATKPGNVSDRESTKPTISEIVVTKAMDKTSPNIFTEACVGKAKPKVEIHFCQTGENVSPYMQYTLSNVLVSNYQAQRLQDNNVTANATPVETINLNFDKIEMKYTPYDEKHAADSPVPAGYDLNTAKKI